MTTISRLGAGQFTVSNNQLGETDSGVFFNGRPGVQTKVISALAFGWKRAAERLSIMFPKELTSNIIRGFDRLDAFGAAESLIGMGGARWTIKAFEKALRESDNFKASQLVYKAAEITDPTAAPLLRPASHFLTEEAYVTIATELCSQGETDIVHFAMEEPLDGSNAYQRLCAEFRDARDSYTVTDTYFRGYIRRCNPTVWDVLIKLESSHNFSLIQQLKPILLANTPPVLAQPKASPDDPSTWEKPADMSDAEWAQVLQDNLQPIAPPVNAPSSGQTCNTLFNSKPSLSTAMVNILASTAGISPGWKAAAEQLASVRPGSITGDVIRRWAAGKNDYKAAENFLALCGALLIPVDDFMKALTQANILSAVSKMNEALGTTNPPPPSAAKAPSTDWTRTATVQCARVPAAQPPLSPASKPAPLSDMERIANEQRVILARIKLANDAAKPAAPLPEKAPEPLKALPPLAPPAAAAPAAKGKAVAECYLCFEEKDQWASLKPCGHIVCKGCTEGEGLARPGELCPSCKKPIEKAEPAFLPVIRIV